MLLQAVPPDTSGYMIAGYAIFSLIMAIYLFSLFVRRRNLQEDLNILESLRVESEARAGKAPPGARTAGKERDTRPTAGRRKPARKKITRKR